MEQPYRVRVVDNQPLCERSFSRYGVRIDVERRESHVVGSKERHKAGQSRNYVESYPTSFVANLPNLL
jgi:hypothetical protein